MQIAICDDDEFFLGKLQDLLRIFFKQHHLALPEIITFTNGNDLLSHTGGIDILFLDIEMPGMNGIYIGNVLKKRNDAIIIFIITAYNEYLDEAMRFHVFRYLSKPLEKQRLFRNLNDALIFYHSISKNIAVETKEEVFILPTRTIISIEARGRISIVHTEKQDYTTHHNMQYWTGNLPKNCFVQSHRSFIVNLQYVSSFKHDIIYLQDGLFTAYLTKRKYKEFKNNYMLYLESMR